MNMLDAMVIVIAVLIIGSAVRWSSRQSRPLLHKSQLATQDLEYELTAIAANLQLLHLL